MSKPFTGPHEVNWLVADTLSVAKTRSDGKTNNMEIIKVSPGASHIDTPNGPTLVPTKVVKYRPDVFYTDPAKYNHSFVHYKSYPESVPLSEIRKDMEILATFITLKPLITVDNTGLNVDSILDKLKAIYAAPNAEKLIARIFDKATDGSLDPAFFDKILGETMPEPKMSVPKRALTAVKRGAAVGLIGAANRKAANTITTALAPNLPESVPLPILEKGIEILTPLLVLQMLEFPQFASRLPADMVANIQTAATMALESGTADGVDKIATEMMGLIGPMLMEYANAGAALNALEEPQDVFDSNFSTKQREREYAKEL